MMVARHAAWALLLISGCFHPNYDHPHCGPNGECPSGLTCSAKLVCEGVGDMQYDAHIDTPNVPADAMVCFGTGIVKVCLAAAPSQPLTISSAITIDTSTSSLCVPTVSGGSGYCVIAATSIDVAATLRATGARPLVLIASDTIMSTAGGRIDVGSHRGAVPETGAGADPTFCAAGTPPDSSSGGAGGSFMGVGGQGGSGAMGVAGGVAAPAVSNPTELRGGCAGQAGNGSSSGAGGHGGGAVFLIAGGSIGVAGSIGAAGEGGAPGSKNTSGAGGGGAGGMIGFDAPMITGSGLILASGGGGGEGSGGAGIPGVPGADPISITAAPGGSGGSGGGGDGGNGSAGAAAGAGAPGFAGINGGGGGGGGGAGLVKAPASANLGSQVSPAPTP